MCLYKLGDFPTIIKIGYESFPIYVSLNFSRTKHSHIHEYLNKHTHRRVLTNSMNNSKSIKNPLRCTLLQKRKMLNSGFFNKHLRTSLRANERTRRKGEWGRKREWVRKREWGRKRPEMYIKYVLFRSHVTC